MYKDKISERHGLTYDQPLFVFVFVLSIFINKVTKNSFLEAETKLLISDFSQYVLSVLNFTYPTIFQGWQTLVGVIILKIFVVCSNNKSWQVIRLEKYEFLLLLPHFIFYVSALVAGSKALSKLVIFFNKVPPTFI
jgi:hypothetical protein